MAPHESHFVRVSEDGMHFELRGRPFYFAGANCYYLMTRAADPGLQHEVLAVMDAAKAAGLKVLRTWAFNDGPQWNALQPRPGEFDEKVFRGLDFVVHQAGKRGLKLVLTLVNYWSDYGGMAQYVRWSSERRGTAPASDKPEGFYSDPQCRDIFQNFMVTVTSRENTFTKVAYRDDPTIMAWELANEPRCMGDYSGSILQNWIEHTAEFMKSIAPQQLLTVGVEGFMGGLTPELLPDNPFDCLNLGCDFLRAHLPDHIDFATIHVWPDTWMAKADEQHRLDFARRWINSHVDVCGQLGKPLVVAEFGKKPTGKIRRDFYDKVYSRVLHHAKVGHPMAGSLFWMLAAPTYPDYDGFTVYLTPPQGGPPPSPPVTPATPAPDAESHTLPHPSTPQGQLIGSATTRQQQPATQTQTPVSPESEWQTFLEEPLSVRQLASDAAEGLSLLVSTVSDVFERVVTVSGAAGPPQELPRPPPPADAPNLAAEPDLAACQAERGAFGAEGALDLERAESSADGSGWVQVSAGGIGPDEGSDTCPADPGGSGAGLNASQGSPPAGAGEAFERELIELIVKHAAAMNALSGDDGGGKDCVLM